MLGAQGADHVEALVAAEKLLDAGEPLVHRAPAGGDEVDEDGEVVHACRALGADVRLDPLELSDRPDTEPAHLGEMTPDRRASLRTPSRTAEAICSSRGRREPSLTGATIASRSDGLGGARLRPPAGADRPAAGRSARRVAPARVRALDRRAFGTALPRAAGGADARRAPRRQRHAGRPGAAPPAAARRWCGGSAAAGAGRRGAVGASPGLGPAAAGHGAGRGRARRVARGGALARARSTASRGERRRCRLHHRAARRPRALPDRVLARVRLGGRADRPACTSRPSCSRGSTSSA